MAGFEHQRLIEYLDREMQDRNLSIAELAALIGLNPSQLYNLRNGKQPGLQVCIDIARALKRRPDYILYLAGHITEEELDMPENIPPEILPTINKLERMKGTPFFDTAINIMEAAVDKVMDLFKIAA